jgi:hypothetical protein
MQFSALIRWYQQQGYAFQTSHGKSKLSCTFFQQTELRTNYQTDHAPKASAEPELRVDLGVTRPLHGRRTDLNGLEIRPLPGEFTPKTLPVHISHPRADQGEALSSDSIEYQQAKDLDILQQLENSRSEHSCI